jgi:hypothetical protein
VIRFTIPELDQIRRGLKTQHALPLHQHRTTHTPNGVLKPPVKPCHIKIGRAYTASHGLRIEVTNVTRATLADIDPRPHGFPTLEDFRDYWKTKRNLKPDRPLNWDRPVWIIAFKTYDDSVTYLANANAQADYTTRLDQAAHGEPAVIHAGATTHIDYRHHQRLTRERAALAASFHDLPLYEQVRLLSDADDPRIQNAVRAIQRTARQAADKLHRAA